MEHRTIVPGQLPRRPQLKIKTLLVDKDGNGRGARGYYLLTPMPAS